MAEITKKEREANLRYNTMTDLEAHLYERRGWREADSLGDYRDVDGAYPDDTDYESWRRRKKKILGT